MTIDVTSPSFPAFSLTNEEASDSSLVKSPWYSLEKHNEETFILNMGPHHPSTHGVLRLVLELDGEVVRTATPDIGYLHTGIEKTCEQKRFNQVTPVTDRMDYLNPLGNNLVYALAVEKLLEVEIPKRAQYIRVLLCELTRIASHMLWLGTHALDIGAMTVFFYCWREREKVLALMEDLAGVRMMTSLIRIGGISRRVQPAWLKKVETFLDEFPPRVAIFEKLLTKNPIWLDRTVNVGVISAEEALNLSMSGATLRASGLAFDIRKIKPYSGYQDFNFDIPVFEDGDIYSRYLVRIEELRQSVSICRQVLQKLPDDGEWTKNRKVAPPPYEEVSKSMEPLIHHFKLVTSGMVVPKGESYVSVESPKGELGCYLVSDGSEKPYRLHFRAPSFMNIPGMCKMMQGRYIADVIAIIGSIDIVMGEVDR